LIGETIREFETTGANIETCFNNVSKRYIKAFDEINDEYLQERAGDIRDVAQRVLRNLLGQAAHHLGELAEKRIVVANDITPSDAAGINRSTAIGIVTDVGSKTSHAVIVARSLKIPAVVGVRDLTTRVKSGDRVLVDGYEGVVIVNPTEQTLLRYGRIQTEKKSFESRLQVASRLPSETLDGVHVVLLANLEKADEGGSVRDSLSEGVGLFRTEYLYLNSSGLPSEEEQFAIYRSVATAFAPNPVVIRTLDIGGDKPLENIPGLNRHETNPFLGFRAIRLCLEHPELFKEQLRAILRASAFGRVRMMYPMISGVDELMHANAILEEAKDELRKRNVAFDDKMEVGSMIEIPSAAATADLLARHCQFFSIGTNDLIQYLLAVDRGNDRIAHLYEPTHPAVLRTIKSVVNDAHKRHLPVAVCGEMAGDPVFAPLLLGLGVDELSMAPSLLAAVKYMVRAMKMSDARQLAVDALAKSDPKEIYAMAEAFYSDRVKVD
jgi:phosphotransferase system enzyme I (PtsI)